MIKEEFDIVVLGAGRIGTTLGIGLSKRYRVALLGVANPFNKNGEIIFEQKTKEKVFLNQNLKFFSEAKHKKIALADGGLIVLATKTIDLSKVTERYILPLLFDRHSFLILCVQNGVTPELIVEETLRKNKINPDDCLVAGIILGKAEFKKVRNERVLSSKFDRIILGAWNNFEKRIHLMRGTARILQDITLISIAGDKTEYLQARFEKAIMNQANSLSAIFGAKIGEILENPQLNEWLWNKINEAILVANKNGANLSGKKVKAATLKVYEELVYDHYTSMAQDIFSTLETPRQPATTEIDQLDLAFWKLGTSKGYAPPLNKFFGKYIKEFCFSLNNLRKTKIKDASHFGKELIDLNRKSVGLEPLFGQPELTTQPSTLGGLADLKQNLEKLQRQFKIHKKRTGF